MAATTANTTNPTAEDLAQRVRDPTIEDIRTAQRRIQHQITNTPVLTSRSIAADYGFDFLGFKAENMQRTGSFKVRGATNAVLKVREQNPDASVFVTHSSGNHGQALAVAARSAGAKAFIICPNNAPKPKVNAMKGYQAEVVFCKPILSERETTAARVMEEQKANHPTFIHAYDDPDVIAGQGTLGLEIVTHCQAHNVDTVFVAVGGGGLMSGVSTAIKALSPRIRVVGVEPEGADDATRSFKEGKVLPHRPGHPKTIADGVLTTLSDRTFGIIRKNVDVMVTVSEKEIAKAMYLVMERMKVVIEPSAAVPVAAALFRKHQLPQETTRALVVLCGGNIELGRLEEYFSKL